MQETAMFIRKRAVLTIVLLSAIIFTSTVIYTQTKDNSPLTVGEKLFNEQKYDEAIEEFKKGLTTNNKDDKKILLAYIGYAYQLQSKYTEAVEYYKESLTIDPDYLYSIEMLGIMYMGGLKDYEKGMEYNVKAEKLGSKNSMVYYNMACYYSVKKDKEKAFKYLDIALYHDYRDVESLKSDTDFNNIKTDNRFINLVNNFQYIIEGDKLFKQALVYEGKSEFSRSVDLYQNALVQYKKAFWETTVNLASCYNKAGLACNLKGDFDLAIKYIEQALKIDIIVFGINHICTAMDYNNLGWLYKNKKDYDSAIVYYKKSLNIKLAVLGENNLDSATNFDNLGDVYLIKEVYDQAKICYEKSLNIRLCKLGENHIDTAISYNSIGDVCLIKGEYDRGKFYYEKSLNIRLSVLGENHTDTASSYNMLGRLCFESGDYDKSIEYHEKAIAIRIKIFGEKNTEVAQSYNNLGESYRLKNDYKKAEYYYKKALSICNDLYGDDFFGISFIYNNLSLIYGSKGDYDLALDYAKKAMLYREKLYGEKSTITAISYENIATAYRNKKDYKKAIEYYEKSFQINSKLLGEFSLEVARGYRNLGVVYAIQNNYISAIMYLDKAVTIYKKNESNQYTVMYSSELGDVYIKNFQYKQSLGSYLIGIETIEKVRKLNLSGGTDFTSRNINLYYYATNAGFLQNDLNSMFNISERMRAMGYIERLSLKGAMDVAGIDAEKSKKLLKLKDDIERLSSLRQKLISIPISSMNEKQKKDHDVHFEQTSKELAQAETDFTKLDTEFMKNEKYKLLRDTAVVTVAEAQKLCGKDGAIIEYIIPDKPDKYMKPYAIVITAGSIKSVELDSAYNFSDQIEKYRKAIKDNKKIESDQLGAELYTKLIAPVNSFINSAEIKKLIIVPDGSLAFLPFDSIKTKDNKYFSERYELNLTPSVTVSSMIKSRKYDKKDNLMAFGGGLYSSIGESKTRGESSFRGIAVDDKQKEKLAEKAYNSPLEYYNAQQLGWADLPGTEREVSAINEKIYNKKNTDVYTGSKVSEENLKSLSKSGTLKKYSSIHLACHGYYDPEYPGYSAVVFSEVSGKLKNSKDDGYMSVEETALLNLQSDIVVLSACETGLGRMVSGDGVIGLTRAFQVAGSNRVLVTLWPVSDEATEEFMVSFYGKVKAGMSYREALVKVKDEFRRSKDYSAPYFWAGFVLYE